MDYQKKIAELKEKISELKGQERTLENAQELVNVNKELKALEADYATIQEAEKALEEFEASLKAESEKEEEAPAEEPKEESAPVEKEEEAPAEEATVEPVAVAASATPMGSIDVSDDRPVMSVTASAGNGAVAQGTALDTVSAMTVLNKSIRTARSEGSGHILSVQASGTSRPLDMNMGTMETTKLINQARESARSEQNSPSMSVTAAACFCAPDQVIPDIKAVGTLLTPVVDILPTIPINGGYRRFDDICANTNSVTNWDCTDQDNVDPDTPATWKQCSELDCFSEVTVTPYNIVGCTTVKTHQMWAHEYQVQAWLDRLAMDYAKQQEVNVLDKLEADATPALTVGAGTMAGQGLLSLLLYSLGIIDSPLAHEFDTGGIEDKVVVVDKGFKKALLADEHLRGFNHNKSMSELDAKLSQDYGIRLIETPHVSTSRAAAMTALVAALRAGGPLDDPALQNAWRLYIFDPTQYVRGEGMMVNAQWVTDDALLRQNKTRYFLEGIEVIDNIGCQKPAIVDIVGCINGTRADLAPVACV